MSVSVESIRALRERSGAGMMDCKRALQENSGDMEKAVDWLRKEGLAAALKRAGRVAKEGVVVVRVDGGRAVIAEVNCETDFVARNEEFQGLASKVAAGALALGEANKVGEQMEEEVRVLAGKLGENLQVSRVEELTGDVVVHYVHNALGESMGRIGVAVGLATELRGEGVERLGKELAMHVAASVPLAVSEEGVAPDVVARERAVLESEAGSSGKAAEVVAKMVEGRLRKFYAGSVLLLQPFVMDGKTPVKQVLQERGKELGGEIAVAGFVRVAVGEGAAESEEEVEGGA